MRANNFLGDFSLNEQAYILLGRLIARSDPSRLERWASLGLTMTQLRVLFILRAEPGVSAGRIAELLGVTPSTLTRIMDRLVRNDLIQRDGDDDDRRLVRHTLTARGAEIVEETDRTFRARMNDAMGRLSETQLERVVAALIDLTVVANAAEAEHTRVAV